MLNYIFANFNTIDKIDRLQMWLILKMALKSYSKCVKICSFDMVFKWITKQLDCWEFVLKSVPLVDPIDIT